MVNSDFTFWGHNCFLIETDNEALLIDPWLNDTARSSAAGTSGRPTATCAMSCASAAPGKS